MAVVTVTVEANFSGSAWTDISAYLESEVTISGGRQDELSQADANQCSFTLDNRDGRFTPGKSTGAYYPNVKVGVLVRVTAAIDTATSRRFTGFVDSWRLVWDGGQDAAYVEVSATSIMARLGLLSERRAAVEEEVLLDSPLAYYPMFEPSGSTAASDYSGNGVPNLVAIGDGANVVFGSAVGPPADGFTAAQFFGGKYLTTDSLPTITPRTVESFVLADSSVTSGIYNIVASGLTIRYLAATGQVDVVATGGSVTSSRTISDGNTHHVAATVDTSGVLTLYIDGTANGTAAGVSPSPTNFFTVGVGLAGAFTGTIAHAAAYPTALSSTRITAHYTAAMTGFQGETVTARLTRYAAWGRYGAVSSTSTTPVAIDDYSGSSVVDLMHNLETTEAGVLYDERDNTLTLKTRQARYAATTAATFDAAAQQLESEFSPVTDRQGIANDVTVDTPAGSANYADFTSQTTYGIAKVSITSLATETTDAMCRAQWEVTARATPKERVPTLAVDFLNCGINPATLLALTVGSRVAVTNPPSQAAGPGDYFIEGWSETFSPASYDMTFNVSPAQPWVNTFILDDPIRGVLDSTYVLAY